MDEGVRRRILTSVSAGALAGVLGAGGMAVAVGGPSYPADVVEGACGVPGSSMTVQDLSDRDRARQAEQERWNKVAAAHWRPATKMSAWFGAKAQAAE